MHVCALICWTGAITEGRQALTAIKRGCLLAVTNLGCLSVITTVSVITIVPLMPSCDAEQNDGSLLCRKVHNKEKC